MENIFLLKIKRFSSFSHNLIFINILTFIKIFFIFVSRLHLFIKEDKMSHIKTVLIVFLVLVANILSLPLEGKYRNE
jgi:hypothetical protein